MPYTKYAQTNQPNYSNRSMEWAKIHENSERRTNKSYSFRIATSLVVTSFFIFFFYPKQEYGNIHLFLFAIDVRIGNRNITELMMHRSLENSFHGWSNGVHQSLSCVWIVVDYEEIDPIRKYSLYFHTVSLPLWIHSSLYWTIQMKVKKISSSQSTRCICSSESVTRTGAISRWLRL